MSGLLAQGDNHRCVSMLTVSDQVQTMWPLHKWQEENVWTRAETKRPLEQYSKTSTSIRWQRFHKIASRWQKNPTDVTGNVRAEGEGKMKQTWTPVSSPSVPRWNVCSLHPCFHFKVKLWPPTEVLSKTMKNIRKDLKVSERNRNLLSNRKDDSVWDKNKMYSLENFKRDWHLVKTTMWRKGFYKDKMRDVWKENWVMGKPWGKPYICKEKKGRH